MARDFSLGALLRELGWRLGAAAVVVGIFYGLGYVNRIDVLGLARFLKTPFAFFAVAFGLVGLVSLLWLWVQRFRW